MSTPTQLDRIEAKLDALLMALADEADEEKQQGYDLDGNPIPTSGATSSGSLDG